MATMRLKSNWPLWSTAGLGCLIVGIMIVKRTATVTGQRAVAAERSRHQAYLDARPMVQPTARAKSPPAFAPTPAPSQAQPVIPDVQSAPQLQRAAATEHSSTEQTRE